MKSKIGKAFLRIFAGVLVFLFAVWASLIVWLGPRHVKTRLAEDIAAFWDGKIIIEGVDFNIFHPITVDSVVMENKMGKPCLEAKGVTLLFNKWPGRDPQLTGIALVRLDCKIQFEEGDADLPLKKMPTSSSGQQESSVPFDSFTVDNFTIHLSNTKDASMLLDDLSFSVVNKQTGYNLSVKQRSFSDSDNFSLSGYTNSEDSQVNLSLGLTKHVNKSLAAGILSLLELPLSYEFEGNISTDITMTGRLDNLGDLQPAGTITLKDCSVMKDQTVWAEKASVLVKVNESHIQVEQWMADSFGGQIQGSLVAEIEQNTLAKFHGQIKGNQLQASKIMGALTDTEKSDKGILAFDYTFSADHGNLQQMMGQGTITLEQVDLQMIPLVLQIIRTLSLNVYETQNTANANGTFEVAGSTVTFQQARLANDWVAIETLPGGTVDLQTGRIDGYVIVAPIKQIRQVLRGIPVMKLFVNLTERLTCLRVKGNYSDVSNIKITKEPLRDVGKGTLDFFRGVADTGNDFINTTTDTSSKDNNK